LQRRPPVGGPCGDQIFDAYLDRGGNFIDTANKYTDGTSEQFVGEFAEGLRDRLVIATKYTLLTRPGDPNSGGNHRKSMVRSVEASLRRLQTDYLDLLYLHAWDATTPVEEVLRAMDDLVRAGKVLYVPMAAELGLGVVPWSPLGSGVLTGKYTRADLDAGATGAVSGTRRDVAANSGALSERGLAIADVVRQVAGEMGATPAQVALAWTLRNPAVTAPIIGARTPAQLADNLGALDVRFTDAQAAALEDASAVELGFPHDLLTRPMTRSVVFGDVTIEGVRPAS
jgi:aryl-alcohol dehydrogenase-like predicted oxidoreductase